MVEALYADSNLSAFPIIDRFAGLRALCQLLLRRDAGRMILPFHMSEDECAAVLPELASARVIEELRVELRDRVLRIAFDMLEDWPHRFIAMTEKARISRVHFNSVPNLPDFFSAVVDQSLAKQNRWVRKEDVLALVHALRLEGVRVTKAEIRRRLHWQGDIPDDWLKFALLASCVLFGTTSESHASRLGNLRTNLVHVRQDSGGTVPTIRRNCERAQQTSAR